MSKDITDKYIGQRFGSLVIVSRDYNKEALLVEKNGTAPHRQYVCVCDCGREKTFDIHSLTSGRSRSCGCLRSKDLTGKVFGHLYVTGLSDNYDAGSGKHKLWSCKCLLCGNIIDARSSDLKSGQKLHCGCQTPYNCGRSALRDLTGMVFGHLRVIKRDMSIGIKSGQHASWICECDICGSVSSVTSVSLTKYGKDRCSNCAGLPLGEAKISELLLSDNLDFEHDVSYKDCIFPVTGSRLRFDFIVHDKRDYVIEYDGIQHYKEIKPWESKIDLRGRIDRDNYKNDWCRIHGVPIIRIPYTHLDSICLDDLRPDTSRFLI